MTSEATLWLVDLRAEVPDERCLSDAERARAARFVFAQDRSRFVIGRTALRTLLGWELGTDPVRVALTTGLHGRPMCASLGGMLDFNLSNSGDIAVIAMAAQMNVGVDIETIRPVHDALDLARHYFPDDEAQQLQKMPAQERDRAFLTCWTRKEAVLKATGLGLGVEPSSVKTGIEAAPASVATTEGSFDIDTLPLDDFGGDDAIVTLAVPRRAASIRVRHFQFSTAAAHS